MKNPTVYLVAYYSLRPRHRRVRTEKAGWMKNPDNVSYDESISITTKLKNRDIDTAKIILDLTNQKVYRNGWGDNKTFESLFEHFYSGYKQYLDPVMTKLGYDVIVQDDGVPAAPAQLTENETISTG